MFLTWMAFERRSELRAVAWFALGTTLFPALLALWQWSEGALAALAHAYFVDGFSAPRFGPAHALASACGSRRRSGRCSGSPRPPSSCSARSGAGSRSSSPASAICGVALVAQHVYLLPIRFLHSLIPAVVPVALVTAWAAQEVFLAPGRGAPDAAGRDALRRAALVAAVLGVGLYEASLRRYDGRLLRQQLARAERIAAIVPPGEPTSSTAAGPRCPIRGPSPTLRS